MTELSVLIGPKDCVPKRVSQLAPPLLRHRVGRLKTMTNCPYYL